MKTILQGAVESAMTVSTAIAKGKSYPSKHDFAKHLYFSRGSVYETMTLFEILKRNQAITDEQFAEFEEMGNKTTAMLSALIKSLYKPSEKTEGGRAKT